MKLFLTLMTAVLFSCPAFAESAKDGNQAGFDYNRGKLKGRATVAGRLAAIQLTGEAAEAMYYQMGAPVQEDIGCTRGQTKWFRGMSCTKYRFPGSEKEEYECWVNLNLKNGSLASPGDACPDLEHEDAFWDARGNKGPRVPDFTGLDGD